MTVVPERLTLEQWDARHAALRAAGLQEPWYGGPLGRHADDGDTRLLKLRFDNSPAALRLWNFLLTEEDRLRAARDRGGRLVGTMKDLGTVPVLAYATPELTAFYPDGAWWIPCVMELNTGLLDIADRLGIDESFCPVRAMLGAFLTEAHFPIPDLLTCSVGATCDDFSAIAQRLNGLGYPILWWEMPHRRRPAHGEPAADLPGGFVAPADQVAFVKGELARVHAALQELAGHAIPERALRESIARTNRVRRALDELRQMAYASPACPMPALEMLIAEMLAIHFCSDQHEAALVLEDLLEETRRRVDSGLAALPADAARVFWVNPVADLRAMNLLEESGGRVCGTEYLFAHALDPIPEALPPLDALARMALADPMAGSTADRARRIGGDIGRFGAEGVIVSRIPGASHCATEGAVIRDTLAAATDLPVIELEVPPLSDAVLPTLRTRIQALVETIRQRRKDRTCHAGCGN